MNNAQFSNSRFIVGILLVAGAAAMFLFGDGRYSTAGAVALAVLGLVSIAISRKGKSA